MFLFKASSADYHDWCAPPAPPPDSPSNGWLPKAVEGRPFLSTALMIFHRETSPFFHSFAPQSSPPTVSSSSTSPFSFYFSVFFLFGILKVLSSGHGSTLGARCSPCKHLHPVPSFCFDSLPMLLCPLLWAGGRLSYMARRLGLCSQVVSLRSDWSGRNSGRERGLADGSVPGAQRQQCSWSQGAIAGCHGGQVADSLFLPLRDWQLGAHGAGAVRGCGQLREAGELGDQPQGRRDGGRDWEEWKWWVDSCFVFVPSMSLLNSDSHPHT